MTTEITYVIIERNMGKQLPANKVCCEAMTEDGVSDPESQEGIDFCVFSCPYDHCVIAEPIVSSWAIKIQERKAIIGKLNKEGYSTKEISQLLEISESIVKRNLR